MKKIFVLIVLLIATALLFGCYQFTSNVDNNTPSLDNNQPATGGQTKSVSIQNLAFSPANLIIAPGITITWTNNDSTTHTVTADDGSFDSGTLSPGQSYSHTFTSTGSTSYHCNIHPMMKATIAVHGLQ